MFGQNIMEKWSTYIIKHKRILQNKNFITKTTANYLKRFTLNKKTFF